MFEHEPDSDDDFECYFLKPVNEYNITDKIKEANQELFQTPHPGSPSNFPRKVQFRKILEDYADGGDNISIVSIESDNDKKLEVKRHNLNGIPEESSKEFVSIDSDTDDICEEIIELQLDDVDVEPKRNTAAVIEEIFTNENVSNEKQKNSKSLVLREISLNSKESGSTDKISSRSSSEDNISVIVASYIDSPNQSKFSDNDSDGKNSKSHSIRKFSLRKKKKIAKLNRNSSNKSPITADDVKFNYKNCCEYRNAIDCSNDKLPKYTGYLSEYGLTQQQWEEREKHNEKGKKRVLERNLKASETEIQRMDDNERAFTRWLKNKMRFPVNKTKNMFDFKPKRSKKK